MSSLTPNYNLVLPTGAEDYDIDVFNANFQAIDTALKVLADAFSAVIKFTPEGGIAYRMTNKTGAASIKGTVVSAASTTNNAFVAQSNEFDSIGVVYEDGIADGALCWVVKNGTAEVLLEDSTASTAGNWVIGAVTNGRANASQPTPTPNTTLNEHTTHFKEIGHCLETKLAGVNVLAKINLHFN